MAQQTSVEQLINYMKENFYLTDEALQKFDKAKEMEKQQKIGLLKWMNKVASEEPMRLETDFDDIVEQYYTETYGK